MSNNFTGPIPKRSAERRRRNKPTDGVDVIKVNLDEALAGEVSIPAPPKQPVTEDGEQVYDLETGEELWEYTWHEIAVEAYLSLSRSGQAIFMEPSDWATAIALCEMLSRELKPKPIIVQVGEGETEIQWVIQPVNGAVMNAFLKGWASLMATEGDRRRLRIELERKKAVDAALAGDGVVVPISKTRDERFAKAAQEKRAQKA